MLLAGRRMLAPDVLESVMRSRRPGDTVEIVFESRGAMKRAEVTLMENQWMRVVRFEDAGMELSAEQRAFRESWLSSKTE